MSSPSSSITHELWFILVANPDGYDYTFDAGRTACGARTCATTTATARSATSTASTPTATSRRTGATTTRARTPTSSSETYRGAGPLSEPEDQAFDGLVRRVDFAWNKNDHTFGRLLLYPFGWQVDTHAADEPIFRALAGRDDDHPGIPTFDPDARRRALHHQRRHQRPPLRPVPDDLVSRPKARGGTDTGSGFIFQDVEADVQAEFERHVQFALDIARSAKDPAHPVGHLDNDIPMLRGRLVLGLLRRARRRSR